jgi:hypothetical protein
LRWKRLEPFRKSARLVEAHWDGIKANCHEQNVVALGFVERLNYRIRNLQQRTAMDLRTGGSLMPLRRGG